jgi:hypothetical protein
MFAKKIKISISFFVLALTVGAFLLTRHSSMLAEQPPSIQPAPPQSSIANTSEKGAEDKQATKPVGWAPFGFVHDFGKVPRGTPCKHSFCIVNLSNVPLRIISLRMS